MFHTTATDGGAILRNRCISGSIVLRGFVDSTYVSIVQALLVVQSKWHESAVRLEMFVRGFKCLWISAWL